MAKSFERKPLKWGHSFVLIIPSFLIRAEVIDPNKKYKVTLEEIKPNNEN